jgi:hypothetical protein
MTHTSEFTKPPDRTSAKQEAENLAACYARVFLGNDDGKRVLADLRRKFGLQRLSFTRGQSHRHDAIAAAIIDGERGVMSDIEGALLLGAPGQALTEKPAK